MANLPFIFYENHCSTFFEHFWQYHLNKKWEKHKNKPLKIIFSCLDN